MPARRVRAVRRRPGRGIVPWPVVVTGTETDTRWSGWSSRLPARSNDSASAPGVPRSELRPGSVGIVTYGDSGEPSFVVMPWLECQGADGVTRSESITYVFLVRVGAESRRPGFSRQNSFETRELFDVSLRRLGRGRGEQGVNVATGCDVRFWRARGTRVRRGCLKLPRGTGVPRSPKPRGTP